MFRMMCKSKIKNATVTKKDLYYNGSIGIDKKILTASNIYPNEVVQVLNQNNGQRFQTYVIVEKEGSGQIVLYGPAARLGEVGDTLTILSNALVESKDAPNVETRVVGLDKKNSILKK